MRNLILLLAFSLILHGCQSKTEISYSQGSNPEITISGMNSEKVKKYEKFEITLDIKDAVITNPYDPADIDVYALFATPSGSEIRINGFYDDYKSAGKWKIRFSPSDTGLYRFRVFLNDGTAKAGSEGASFTAVASEHHGWIRPSAKNPYYFSHHDGTTYYAVGVYSPWGNSEKTFSTFRENNANFMAIWDINYGGFVNDAGLIEEELGRYNQKKLGLIDSLLSILEQDDVKLMYAIWPHDLFSKTVWAAQWKNNPYSKITDVENVYSDSTAWEYQKMKYRYMIARFAHSRSWGVWELINEMNGTDGWAKGHEQEAYEWVRKCVKYFEENDPYGHPVTASFSGGFNEYREPLYELTHIPNIHLYPAQEWELKYPSDTMRSDMYNFAWASRRFRERFRKPAIFGEAGADLTYYKPQSAEYHISFHNQIWASLANGLAGIPVWWDFSILNDQDWKQIKNLAAFVKNIDFANLSFNPSEAVADEADVYVMDSGDHAFGWARTYSDNDIGGTRLSVTTSIGKASMIQWFDPWSVSIITEEKAIVRNGKLEITVPMLADKKPDIAFRITKTD